MTASLGAAKQVLTAFLLLVAVDVTASIDEIATTYVREVAVRDSLRTIARDEARALALVEEEPASVGGDEEESTTIFGRVMGMIPRRVSILPSESVPTLSALSQTRQENRELTCLAQILFSETDLPEDMLFLAWATRNRVDNQYRGKDYCEVAFAPWQFSGLNAGKHQGAGNYTTNMTIPQKWERWASEPEGSWRRRASERYQHALNIGGMVMTAEPLLNPVPGAMWFFSPGAVRKLPKWAVGIPAQYVIRNKGSKTLRWAIYNKINGESIEAQWLEESRLITD